jgi:hypothetical protein
MSRIVRTVALACAAVAAFAGSSRAEESATRFDLRASDRWEKGETVTLTFTEEAVFRLTGDRVDESGKPAGRLPSQGATVGFGGRYVMRCEDVDATGAWTRATVHLGEWHHDTPKRRDTGLAGAFVEVTRDGWALLGTSQNPSPEARRWLDSEFGPGGAARRSDLAGLSAAVPVTSGAVWDANLRTRLDALLALTPFPVVATQADLRPRLTDVSVTGDGAVVRVAGTLTTPLAADGPGETQPAATSALRVECELTGVPGRWHRTGTTRLHGELSLSAANERMRMACTGTLDRRRNAAAGGVIPPLPEPEPSKGPLVRFARSAAWKVGDAFLEEGSESRAGTATPVDAEGREGKADPFEDSVAWTAVHTCRETDESGRARRFGVQFSEWRAVADGAADESLRGVTVEFRPRRGWSIVSADAKPSKRALDWLKQEFTRATADDAVRAAIVPAMTVSPREAWCPDDREMHDAIHAWLPMPVGLETLASCGELATVTVEGASAVATVRYTCDAPIEFEAAAFSAHARPATGGTVAVEGIATGSIAEWERHGTLDETSRVTVVVPEAEGAVRRVELTRRRDRTRTPLPRDGAAASVR